VWARMVAWAQPAEVGVCPVELHLCDMWWSANLLFREAIMHACI
jgi:hypothetical protein